MDDCSFWQLNACVHGFNKANGADKLEPPTNDEFDDMIARMTQ